LAPPITIPQNGDEHRVSWNRERCHIYTINYCKQAGTRQLELFINELIFETIFYQINLSFVLYNNGL